MIRNAKIKSTYLGPLDPYPFVLSLEFDLGNYSYQGVVTNLSSNTDAINKIADLLSLLHVDSWETLVGTYCRIHLSDDGTTITGISSILSIQTYEGYSF